MAETYTDKNKKMTSILVNQIEKPDKKILEQIY
jgi:hypothetical protein